MIYQVINSSLRGAGALNPQPLRIEEAVDRGHWSQAMGSSWSSDGGSSSLPHHWGLEQRWPGQADSETASGGSRCSQLEKVNIDLGVGERGAGWRWQPERSRDAQGKTSRVAGVWETPRGVM